MVKYFSLSRYAKPGLATVLHIFYDSLVPGGDVIAPAISIAFRLVHFVN